MRRYLKKLAADLTDDKDLGIELLLVYIAVIGTLLVILLCLGMASTWI